MWKDKSGKGDDEDIFIKAIHREIKEETGLSVEKATTKILHSASGFNKKKGVFTVALGYICKVKENNVKLSEEHSDFRWVTKKEFMDLDVGDDGGLIKGILEKV